MHRVIIEFVSLFLAGMLAGAEFLVRYGVRGPLAELEDRAHIQLRQGLIRTLRVLVPSIAVPALVTAVATALVEGFSAGLVLRCAGVFFLLIWLLVTIFGTVPINAAVFEWRPDAPPRNWKALVDRWERLNTVRTWAAFVAFVALLIAAALRSSAL